MTPAPVIKIAVAGYQFPVAGLLRFTSYGYPVTGFVFSLFLFSPVPVTGNRRPYRSTFPHSLPFNQFFIYPLGMFS